MQTDSVTNLVNTGDLQTVEEIDIECIARFAEKRTDTIRAVEIGLEIDVLALVGSMFPAANDVTARYGVVEPRCSGFLGRRATIDIRFQHV
jgi:hypothetical protein